MVSELVEFPNIRKSVAEVIDKGLDQIPFQNEALEKCVRERVKGLISRYVNMKWGINLSFGSDIGEDERISITNQVNEYFGKYMERVLFPMISDVIVLSARVCRLELGLNEYQQPVDP